MSEKQNIVKTAKKGLINYPLGDFLIRIKNSARAGYREVKSPFNKLNLGVSKLLEKEGYLREVKKEGNLLVVSLAFLKKEPVITDLRLVSKPGLRIYMNVDNISEKKGSSIYIISTPKGLMTTKEAIKNNMGGEVLVEIF